MSGAVAVADPDRDFDPALGDGAQVMEDFEWVERPTAEDMAAVMPAGGPPLGMVGVRCTLWHDGGLRYCSFTPFDEPDGAPFLKAAEALIPKFRGPPYPYVEGKGQKRVEFSLYFGSAGQCLPPTCSIVLPPPPLPPKPE